MNAFACLQVPRTSLPVWASILQLALVRVFVQRLLLKRVLARLRTQYPLVRVFVQRLLLERVLVRLRTQYPLVRVWNPLLLPVRSLLRLLALVLQGCRQQKNRRA